jgi:hypothetical protein
LRIDDHMIRLKVAVVPRRRRGGELVMRVGDRATDARHRLLIKAVFAHTLLELLFDFRVDRRHPRVTRRRETPAGVWRRDDCMNAPDLPTGGAPPLGR